LLLLVFGISMAACIVEYAGSVSSNVCNFRCQLLPPQTHDYTELCCSCLLLLVSIVRSTSSISGLKVELKASVLRVQFCTGLRMEAFMEWCLKEDCAELSRRPMISINLSSGFYALDLCVVQCPASACALFKYSMLSIRSQRPATAAATAQRRRRRRWCRHWGRGSSDSGSGCGSGSGSSCDRMNGGRCSTCVNDSGDSGSDSGYDSGSSSGSNRSSASTDTVLPEALMHPEDRGFW
jgi:hypothetical protein